MGDELKKRAHAVRWNQVNRALDKAYIFNSYSIKSRWNLTSEKSKDFSYEIPK